MKYFIIIIIVLFSCRTYKNVNSKKNVKIITEYSLKDETTGSIMEKGKLYSISNFDKTGKIIEKKMFDTSANINSIFKYEYDSLGNCIIINEYNKEFKLINKKESLYDKNGKIIPFLLINSTSFCNQKHIKKQCEYDKEGNIISAIKYDEFHKNMIIIKKEFKYEYW